MRYYHYRGFTRGTTIMLFELSNLYMNLNISTYKNKVVIVTGHTGFKGSWLRLWLKDLGANVIGISKQNNT